MDNGVCGIAPYEIRKIILEQSKRANVGHIGSALSVADIIAALYGGAMKTAKDKDPERDRFVLSKGHAALALYAALYLKGYISRKELDTFCGEGSRLGVHPESCLSCVDFSTGSLGQGLSMAAGAALAARLQNSPRRVFALLSDGECNEGSVWEAAMFAAHHKLSNLIAVLDLNAQQAFGYTEDVLSLSPMAARWRAFNWDVHEIDGHDINAIQALIGRLSSAPGSRPHILVARTVFGKGVPFMENKIKWHYWPMSDEEYRQALDAVRESA
ncbi:MAG: transketolase [Elusimicrobia bacterium GWA2_56_46]|nr:MAG: transketolase [Elusimicrobia bacterium GWA2_56_46]OGR54525.1 MAG: transketolase [Elusimicrobia bacterium GWC2_56_31]HBB68196.1 transketolase [Elusimicrobiota bacterium]HBW22327.1 transketolase [Elusimicrobiota bacterium]